MALDLSACSILLADAYVLDSKLSATEKREQRSLERKYLVETRRRVSQHTGGTWITLALVAHRLQLLHTGRAPGPDHVEAELLKYAGAILNDAANHCWTVRIAHIHHGDTI